MFPVLVSVHTPEQLKAVYALLGDGPGAAPAATTAAAATPATATTKKAANKAPAADATKPTEPAKPTVPTLSAAGQAYLQSQLADPVMKLSMKDEPAMKAICAKYGVERVSLIPEKFFPDVLAEVNAALDPGAAERARLEAIEKAREGATPTRSLL